MPIYEFECSDGHRTEKIMSISKMTETPFIVCFARIDTEESQKSNHSRMPEYCELEAYLTWSLPATTQIGRPTIVFKDPRTGLAQIATSSYEQPPSGYIKEEIKGSIERTKFENEQNKLHAHQDDIYNTNRSIEREMLRQQIIDDAKANTSIDAAQSDNASATEHLMKKAIEHIRNKPTLRKKRKTEFRLDVNHLDKSNLK